MDAAADGSGTEDGSADGDAGGTDALVDMDAGDDGGPPQDGSAEGDAGDDAATDAGVCPSPGDGGAAAGHCDATDLIIADVDPGSTITLFNPTGEAVSVADSSYQLCQRPIYVGLKDIEAGATIAAGGSHAFAWPDDFGDTDTGGELALYTSPVFGSPAAQLDFVCWGTGHESLSRKSVAESDGDWCGGCTGAITGESLRRIPGTDGTTADSYDATGAAGDLSCP